MNNSEKGKKYQGALLTRSLDHVDFRYMSFPGYVLSWLELLSVILHHS